MPVFHSKERAIFDSALSNDDNANRAYWDIVDSLQGAGYSEAYAQDRAYILCAEAFQKARKQAEAKLATKAGNPFAAIAASWLDKDAIVRASHRNPVPKRNKPVK